MKIKGNLKKATVFTPELFPPPTLILNFKKLFKWLLVKKIFKNIWASILLLQLQVLSPHLNKWLQLV